jgi:hypothetical protein
MQSTMPGKVDDESSDVFYYASVDRAGQVEATLGVVDDFTAKFAEADRSFAIAWAKYESDKIVAAYSHHPSHLQKALQAHDEKITALSSAKVIELDAAVEQLWDREDFWMRR